MANPDADKEDWIVMFNGKDLTGWTPKIAKHEVGDNFANTFRVENGLLEVRYDKNKYPTFDGQFGHLFYKDPFSYYRLVVEYRFVGEQVAGRPGLGAAQQRRHAAFARSAHHAARSDLSRSRSKASCSAATATASRAPPPTCAAPARRSSTRASSTRTTA